MDTLRRSFSLLHRLVRGAGPADPPNAGAEHADAPRQPGIYDPQNVFAKILRGELPCNKVYEDAATLAFMDILPMSPGHVLVIPKAASINLLDIGVDDLVALMEVARRIATAARSAMQADGITILHYANEAGGQCVFHTHVHVLPRWDGVPLRLDDARGVSADELARQAARIADALGQGRV